MPPEMAGPNGWTELQWTQDHEKQARHDMNKGQDRIARKQIIQGAELCSHRIGCDAGRMIASDYDRDQMYHPPYCDGGSNKGQEND